MASQAALLDTPPEKPNRVGALLAGQFETNTRYGMTRTFDYWRAEVAGKLLIPGAAVFDLQVGSGRSIATIVRHLRGHLIKPEALNGMIGSLNIDGQQAENFAQQLQEAHALDTRDWQAHLHSKMENASNAKEFMEALAASTYFSSATQLLFDVHATIPDRRNTLGPPKNFASKYIGYLNNNRNIPSLLEDSIAKHYCPLDLIEKWKSLVDATRQKPNKNTIDTQVKVVSAEALEEPTTTPLQRHKIANTAKDFWMVLGSATLVLGYRNMETFIQDTLEPRSATSIHSRSARVERPEWFTADQWGKILGRLHDEAITKSPHPWNSPLMIRVNGEKKKFKGYEEALNEAYINVSTFRDAHGSPVKGAAQIAS